MTKRTHSTIDTLPEALRQTLTAMVTDGLWPAEIAHSDQAQGKPTYDDIVACAAAAGHSISRSAVGRWAKGLLTFERMRTAAGIARTVMAEVTDANATETQKAAAEMMTARIIELVADDEMKPKDIAMVSSAIRDCMNVSLQADKYIRTRIADRAKAADAAVTDLVKKKQIDPDTLKMIREQIYGIVE